MITHSPEIRHALEPVDLDALRSKLRGSQYRKLIQAHLRRDPTGEQQALAIQGCISAFTDAERGVAEPLVDILNGSGYEPGFWRQDTADAFRGICANFEIRLSQAGIARDPRLIFNFFQLITLNFTLQALQQPALRRFIGVRRSLFSR